LRGRDPFAVQVTATEKRRDAGIQAGNGAYIRVRKTRTTFVERIWQIHFTKVDRDWEGRRKTSYEVELEVELMEPS
jgi:hypothetical protein